MTIHTLPLHGLVVLALLLLSASTAQSAEPRPRVIVTTDGEVDDRCSMNRFLLYTNEWEVEGLIHSSSKHHWAGDANHPEKKWEPVTWLDRQLDAYEQVHPNLLLHDPAYPDPDQLRARVFVGNIAYEGDMEQSSPGADRIAEVLLDDNPEPVWLQAWGGPNTIARALKNIADNHPDKISAVSRKARIFLISEQDDTYKRYIRPAWPDILVLRSGYPSYGVLAYRWPELQPAEIQPFFRRDWMIEHILEAHGPLCALYETKDGAFRSEGDSPAFLHTIPTGLGNIDNPAYGGWGGRFAPANGLWKSVDPVEGTPHSIVRWAIHFQNDWAARADWCTKSFGDANHPPTVRLAHASDVTAAPGDTLTLDAEPTTDPDGDGLTFHWSVDDGPGIALPNLSIQTGDSPKTTVTLPDDIPSEARLHLLCTVTDTGTPPLTRYARVIVTIAE